MPDLIRKRFDVGFWPANNLGGLRPLELLKDFTYPDGLTIKAGFRWNGVSFIAFRQRMLVASCRHDFETDGIIEGVIHQGYKGVQKYLGVPFWTAYSRANKNFRHNLRVMDNQNAVFCWTFYLGVQMFTWTSIVYNVWKAKRTLKKQGVL